MKACCAKPTSQPKRHLLTRGAGVCVRIMPLATCSLTTIHCRSRTRVRTSYPLSVTPNHASILDMLVPHSVLAVGRCGQRGDG